MQQLRGPAPACTCTQGHGLVPANMGPSAHPSRSRGPQRRHMTSVECRALEQDVQSLISAAATFASPVLVGWVLVERRSNASLNAEVQQLKEQAAQHAADMKALQSQVSELRKAAEQAEFLDRRLQESAKEQFKLERALEMKDGQLESFMVVAQRQIKMLEERCDMLSKGLKP